MRKCRILLFLPFNLHKKINYNFSIIQSKYDSLILKGEIQRDKNQVNAI